MWYFLTFDRLEDLNRAVPLGQATFSEARDDDGVEGLLGARDSDAQRPASSVSAPQCKWWRQSSPARLQHRPTAHGHHVGYLTEGQRAERRHPSQHRTERGGKEGREGGKEDGGGLTRK